VSLAAASRRRSVPPMDGVSLAVPSTVSDAPRGTLAAEESAAVVGRRSTKMARQGERTAWSGC
jgi:hypothetical protein